MTGMPEWLVVILASVVPILGIIGFWMNLSSRLTKAETQASDADVRSSSLSASFSLYREQIAKEYIHKEVMRDVEDRLTQCINQLGVRIDRAFERRGGRDE
jgi:hypothetical protein